MTQFNDEFEPELPDNGTAQQNNPDQENVFSEAEAVAAPGGNDELAQVKKERDQLYERLMRATAEFRNAQRRIELDKDQAVQYANSSLIKSLLPVIDNFERALSVDETATDAVNILKGMQIVHDQLVDVLKRQDVEQIAPNPGDPFDPNLHEALMQQPAPQYDRPTVTQLLQKGYLHHGRALRPAGVAVGHRG